jgi:hypothetical protein
MTAPAVAPRKAGGEMAPPSRKHPEYIWRRIRTRSPALAGPRACVPTRRWQSEEATSDVGVEILVPLIAVPCGCGLTAFIAALLFPSTRGAMAEWVHRKADPDTLESSASAQLMALRNEVYALRVEVAAVAQALPGTDASRRIGAG